MNKTEVYYQFIFPDYNNLSGSDSDGFPNSDGYDQEGEVRALCRKCPERVITYDQLKETDSDNLISMYKTAWDSNISAPYSRDFIKRCVDKYLTIPKYFNLRNYWDRYPCQEGGMSLVVSHTPEIGGNTSGTWTKFTVDSKTIYCSLVVSSGDFYYSFNLPDEVLEKSGLRNEVVRSRFHENWYFTNNERTAFNLPRNGAVYKLHHDFPKLYHGPGAEENEYTTEEYLALNPPYPEGRGYPASMNPHFGQEKRVFVQNYFVYPGFHFTYQGTPKSYINFEDGEGNTYLFSNVYYKDSEGNNHSQSNYADESLVPDKIDLSTATYEEVNVIIENDQGATEQATVTVQKLSFSGNIGYYVNKNNTETKVTRCKYYYKKNLASSNTITLVKSNNTTKIVAVDPYYKVEEYRELNEDLKSDFVDLEVTRRVLHYNPDPTKLTYNGNEVTIQSTKDIPIIKNPVDISWTGTGRSPDLNAFLNKIKGDSDYLDPLHTDRSGKNTVLSYELPDVYNPDEGGVPPLQIPYNLLRYTLNDRPPFTDCETVLVMWVADKDPMSSEIVSASDLNSQCNFQQYAIPISARCRFKDQEPDNKYCHNRFLVTYPFKQGLAMNHMQYAFHIRRSERYEKSKFKEAVYLRDLIEYSKDYVIIYQNPDYYTNGFDVQGYLLKKYYRGSDTDKIFNELYVRKMHSNFSGNHEQQAYYIKVPTDNTYSINTTSENISIRLVKYNDTNVTFVPSEVLTRSNYDKWDFDNGDGDWSINNKYFIALFDANYKTSNNVKVFSTVSGNLTLDSGLRTVLHTITSHYWDDIFISPLGISETRQIDNDSFVNNANYGVGGSYYPLSMLDNYIRIGSTLYGSSQSNHKVVAGLKDLFDYTYDDCCHFKWIDGQYKSIAVKYNYNNESYDSPENINLYCTAYLIDVSQ